MDVVETGVKWTSEEAKSLYENLAREVADLNAQLAPRIMTWDAVAQRKAEIERLKEPLVARMTDLYSRYTVPTSLVQAEALNGRK